MRKAFLFSMGMLLAVLMSCQNMIKSPDSIQSPNGKINLGWY